MIRISTYKIRIPKPGQEGGGVAWGPWLPASPADFEKVLATAESGKCGSCIIRAFHTATQYFEIDINAWNGTPTYSVVKQLTSEPEVVTYKEFRRLLKVDEEEIVLPSPTVLDDEEEIQEYLYRFRHFRNPHDSWANNCGWSNWEFCDEQKYNEIVSHILSSNSPYQAQRFPVEPDRDVCANLQTRGWTVPRYRYRETDGHTCTTWVEVTRDHMSYLMRSAADRCDIWREYEVSRDEGVNWESL